MKAEIPLYQVGFDKTKSANTSVKISTASWQARLSVFIRLIASAWLILICGQVRFIFHTDSRSGE